MKPEIQWVRIILWVFLALFCLPDALKAQKIKGYVYGIEQGDTVPLFMANIYWRGVAKGTQSKSDGSFVIDKVEGVRELIVQYIGYQRDTFFVYGIKQLTCVLQPELELMTVTKTARINAQKLDMKSITNTRGLNEKALQKAPCCNLAESFENTPSIDISFTDALTGTRHIQMLGLAGKYSVISQELIPKIRGLHAINGLHLIPGPWLEGIQITKGSGPVTSGFESISGQINLELKMPEDTDPLFINFYTNQGGRTEINLIRAMRFNHGISTALFVHGNIWPIAWDMNKDGFADITTGGQFNVLNRWKYQGEKGLESILGAHWVEDEKFGGNLDFARERNTSLKSDFPFAIHQRQRYREVFMKTGYVFPEKPNHSMGLQVMFNDFRNTAAFGSRQWNGFQERFYGNFIYQWSDGSEKHTLKAGGLVQGERTRETVQLPMVYYFEGNPAVLPLLERKEWSGGGFTEYLYKPGERLMLSTGLHAVYNQLFEEVLLNPRIHMRIKATEQTTLRVSAGRGVQPAFVFTENMGAFASARSWQITGSNPNRPYGMELEKAWNTGISLSKSFRLDYREGSVNVDYFYTSFQNQVVADWYESASSLHIYQLNGRSQAHSFQAELDYELIRRLEMHLAYRYNEARTDFSRGFLLKPLMPVHRAFANFAYSTKTNWLFDFTVQRFGRARLPYTGDNPEQYQLPSWSSSFYLMHFQITRKWKNRLEIYAGGENALNYRQANPILAPDGGGVSPQFDASMVWAPIFGRMFFAGMRWSLPKSNENPEIRIAE